MGTEPRGDLTALLAEVRAGREDAEERLVRAIYAELHREVADTTVEGDWRFVRAWLHGQLGEAAP